MIPDDDDDDDGFWWWWLEMFFGLAFDAAVPSLCPRTRKIIMKAVTMMSMEL